jgi:hypothetical protein
VSPNKKRKSPILPAGKIAKKKAARTSQWVGAFFLVWFMQSVSLSLFGRFLQLRCICNHGRFQSWRNSEFSYVSCNRVAYTIDVFCVSKSFWVVFAIALYMQSWEVPVLEEFWGFVCFVQSRCIYNRRFLCL